MTDVLILGGTGWLSGRIAHRWLEAGASVTCLARGARSAPAGTELIVADRAVSGAYGAVAGHDWDEVVEISSDPAQVEAAVAAIGPRARHWSYVSSLSVYADNDVPGADESARLSEPLTPGEDDDYSRAKSAAEASVRTLGDRVAIVRPGLIVGPGDPTDRFGYWVARFAAARTEAVLVPGAPGAAAQVIDVEDLAAFVVERGAEGWHGIANAIGDSLPLRTMLELAAEEAGHTGPVVAVDDDWLVGHEVAYWAGPRSLPLWLPADMPGFATRSHSAYLVAGGRLRDVRETLRRTLVDERIRGLARDRRSGLTRAEELALLEDLA